MEFPHLEVFFQGLIDITDKISGMNSLYESDPESDIAELTTYFEKMESVNWEDCDKEYFELFSSHFTFHLKIVEEIISEAREILNPENREYVKKIVAYVKKSEEWFNQLKKKRRSSLVAAAN